MGASLPEPTNVDAEQVIAKVRSHLSAPERREQAGSAASALIRDLDRLERRRNELVLTYPARRTQPSAELIASIARTGDDPVNGLLAYVIVASLDSATAESLEQVAWNEIQQRRGAYADVKDLLPASFRNRVERSFSWQAFVFNTNATALADWAEYRRQVGEAVPAIRRIPTGISALDAAINGLPQFTIVAGPAGIGKTALGLQMLRHALKADQDLMAQMYSFDMPKREIYSRLLMAEAGVPAAEVVGKVDGWSETVVRAEERLKAEVLPRFAVREWSDRARYNTQTAELEALTLKRMLEHREQLQRACGGKRCLVLIDLFQRFVAPGDGLNAGIADENGEQREVNELEADLHRLALLRSYLERTASTTTPGGDSILVVSETRKASARRDELKPDDVRGHGRIVFTADAVLMLESDTDDAARTADTEPIVLTVAKCRDGRKGSLSMLFDHQIYRFREAVGDTGAVGSKNGGPTARRDPFAGLR